MAAGGWRRVFRIDRGPRDVERDVNEEIAFHLEMRTRKLIAAGLNPAAAHAKAVEQFGDLPGVRDECLTIGYGREREMQWSDLVGNVRQDIRYAVRSLRAQPGFTLAVVLMLALGIGANTATFTLIDALLLRTLPVPHPEQLVTIGDPADVNSGWTGSPEVAYASYPVYADVRDQNTVLSGLYASGATGQLDVTDANVAPDPLAAGDHPRGRFVSGNFFAVLEVPVYVGRTFTADEDRFEASDPVAVISYRYWQQQFASDRSAVGRTIRVNGVLITIVGVAPPGFTGEIVGEMTDIWLPMMMQPAIRSQRNMVGDRAVSWLQMMGRLAPGVSLEQARTVLATIEAQSIRAHSSGRQLSQFEEDLKVEPIRVELGARGFSRHRRTYAPALTVLMAAVTLVVLVVCANVANLMLARAAGRGREMTVRMTLGAGRSRLMQQLLTESMLLAVVSAALGLVMASWGSRLLLAIASAGPTPIPLDVAPNLRILGFTGGVTLVCVVLFGLVPALRATRVDLASALRAHGRSLSGSRGRFGRFALGKTLVVSQIALSTLLLIGTGLLVRSMQRMLTVDLGLDRDGVVIMDVSASRRHYAGARLAALMRDAADRARHVPGVVAVSYSWHGVYSGGVSSGHVTVPGFVAQADSQRQIDYDDVGPNYFTSIGARLIRGRDFDARDAEAGARVAAINETAAAYYFHGRDPIGRTVTLDSSTFTIIGVVHDVQESDVRAKPVRHLYFSMAQPDERPHSFVLAVRVQGDPSRSVAPLRTAVLAADRTLPIDVEPLNALVRESVAQDLLVTQVTTFFGVITLVLAALGLYGITAYAATQRTAEFGLRTALGAEPNDVTAMILREAVGLATIGVVVGLPVALAATRLIRGQIFGVASVDLPSLSAAIGLLIATAIVASYLPARRAARIGPLEALRTE